MREENKKKEREGGEREGEGEGERGKALLRCEAGPQIFKAALDSMSKIKLLGELISVQFNFNSAKVPGPIEIKSEPTVLLGIP